MCNLYKSVVYKDRRVQFGDELRAFIQTVSRSKYKQ